MSECRPEVSCTIEDQRDEGTTVLDAHAHA